MSAYEPPRVTFVGSDPKIPALRKAIARAAHLQPSIRVWDMSIRFVGLYQARNRRTRVLMHRVQTANKGA